MRVSHHFNDNGQLKSDLQHVHPTSSDPSVALPHISPSLPDSSPKQQQQIAATAILAPKKLDSNISFGEAFDTTIRHRKKKLGHLPNSLNSGHGLPKSTEKITKFLKVDVEPKKKQTERRFYYKDLVKGHHSLDFYFPGPIVVFLTGNGCPFAIMEMRTNASIYSLIPAVGVVYLNFCTFLRSSTTVVTNIIVHQYWSLHLIECYKQYDIAHAMIRIEHWKKKNTSIWLKSNH